MAKKGKATLRERAEKATVWHFPYGSVDQVTRLRMIRAVCIGYRMAQRDAKKVSK